MHNDREAVALFSDLAEQLLEGLVLIGPGGEVRSVNPAAAEILGRPPADLVGRAASGCVALHAGPSGGFEPLALLMRRAVREGRAAGDGWVDRGHGDTCPVGFRLVPAAGGTMVLAMLDRRPQRRADEAERKAEAAGRRADRLSDDLGELARRQDQARAGVTSGVLGDRPLREALPGLFAELLGRYARLMRAAMAGNEGAGPRGARMKSIADQLGFLGAGPRDVIELHAAAAGAADPYGRLEHEASWQRLADMMLIELMGYLTSAYRKYSPAAVRQPRGGP